MSMNQGEQVHQMSQRGQQDPMMWGLQAGGMKRDFHSKGHGQLLTFYVNVRLVFPKLRGQHPAASREPSGVFDTGAGKLVMANEINQMISARCVDRPAFRSFLLYPSSLPFSHLFSPSGSLHGLLNAPTGGLCYLPQPSN